VRFGTFHASAFSELEKKASRLPWELFLIPGQSLTVRATCHKSRLYHSDGVIERVVSAIEDHLGFKISNNNTQNAESSDGQQMVLVRLFNDNCTISMDTSGELLHRRGYRLATTKAPLRETLAAAIILASDWEFDKPLLDPFCGSGTIPIESAQMAMGIPAGINRRFSFMSWPGFDERSWLLLVENHKIISTSKLPIILASDRDAGAIEMARANAERAGVLDFIQFECKAISAITPPRAPGWVITNPPYGIRVNSNKDLRNLYAQAGKVLKAQCKEWKASFLVSDPMLVSQTGFKHEPILKFKNGGIQVTLESCLIT
jgi:putative N6-adenine-specific DNA methylase